MRSPTVECLLFVVVFTSAIASCDREAAKETDPQAPVREVDRRLELVAKLEQRAEGLGAEWDSVRGQYDDARRGFALAEATLEASGRANQKASDSYSRAAESWQSAKSRWDFYQLLLQIAAAIDAHNLDEFRRLTNNPDLESLDCAAGMSTASYRRRLTSMGISLIGKDVNHIVPRSLGGADHPANYNLMSSSANRSLGNSWGKETCLLAGPQCAGAIAISRRCGTYRGPSF